MGGEKDGDRLVSFFFHSFHRWTGSLNQIPVMESIIATEIITITFFLRQTKKKHKANCSNRTFHYFPFGDSDRQAVLVFFFFTFFFFLFGVETGGEGLCVCRPLCLPATTEETRFSSPQKSEPVNDFNGSP